MLQCVECNCYSANGKGWLAFLAQDPDEDLFAETIVYCPVCATRELDLVNRTSGYR
jgi:hypothetical protein